MTSAGSRRDDITNAANDDGANGAASPSDGGGANPSGGGANDDDASDGPSTPVAAPAGRPPRATSPRDECLRWANVVPGARSAPATVARRRHPTQEARSRRQRQVREPGPL